MPTENRAKIESAPKFIIIAMAAVLGLYFILSLTVTTGSSVVIADKRLDIEISDSFEERQQGLSGRPSLDEDEAMLFVFDRAERYGFWMKDMNFSIDILWIDGNSNIVHIEKNVSPDTYPMTFTPNSPALYVIETVAGWSDDNGLMIGDPVEINL